MKEQIYEIFEFIETPPFQDELIQMGFDWSRICAALDTLLDVECIFSTFLADKRNYSILELYGIIQALIVQQDAVVVLVDAFENKYTEIGTNSILSDVKRKDKWKDIFPDIQRNRDFRNACVGHPAGSRENKPGEFVTSTNFSMNPSSLLLSYYKKNNSDSTETINLFIYVEYQFDTISKWLEVLLTILRNNKKNLENNFSKTSLLDTIATSNYFLEKLSTYTLGHSQLPKEQLQLQIDLLESMVATFKDEYIKKIGVSSIIAYQENASFILKEISESLKYPNPNFLQLRVYYLALSSVFESLKCIAKEVDERFGSALS